MAEETKLPLSAGGTVKIEVDSDPMDMSADIVDKSVSASGNVGTGSNSNPWLVTTLDQFLQYCCPECDDKSKSKESFVNHAILHHPLARESIPDLMAGLEPKEELPEDYDELEEWQGGDHVDEYEDDGDGYEPSSKKVKKFKPKASPTKRKLVSERVKFEEDNPEVECQCYYCGLMTTYGDILSHIRENHARPIPSMYGPPRPVQCEMCKAMFNDHSSMGSHVCQMIKGRVMKEEDGLYHCDECPKTFKKLNGLTRHKPSHSTERNFACKLCAYKGKSHRMLSKHEKVVHTKDYSHTCSNCGKGFHDLYHLRIHLARIHGEGELPDGELKAMERRKITSLTNQGIREAPGTDIIHACTECDKTFTTPQGLACHKNQTHPESRINSRTKCQQCSRWIHDLWMQEHLRMDHPTQDILDSVPTLCETCHQHFANGHDLNQHMLEERHVGVTFSCSQEGCQSVYHSSATSFKRHMAETHMKLIYACDKCSYFTKFKNLFQYHLLEKHTEGQDSKERIAIQCDLCGASPSQLLQHMRSSHIYAPGVMCNRCDAKLECKEQLQEHMERNHQVYVSMEELSKFTKKGESHLCPHCGKSLSTKYQLQSHIKMHEGGGDFLCEHCDFRATRKDVLERHKEAKHLKTHTYYCDQCQFKTHIKPVLNTHIRLVHDKVKPFKCDRCEMSYGYRRDLEKHIDKVHAASAPHLLS